MDDLPGDIEAHNAEILYRQAIVKDCAGKTWWNADIGHASVYRALKVDRSDWTSSYACAPFKFAKVNDQHRILIAWPAPAFLGAYSLDHLDIETVIEWNPVTNRVEIFAEDRADLSAQIVGSFPDTDRGTIFADPFKFFRGWIEQRAAFVTRYRTCRDAHWLTPPIERDHPGVLIVGKAIDVRWRPGELPKSIECVGVNPDVINKAILKAANLPWVSASSSMRAAA